ncbi:MAG: hypothetical protein R3B48_04115 [Kofleriaceae bacterium]
MRRALHLVRVGAAPRCVASTDWLVDQDGARLVLRAHGAPPRAPGEIDCAALLELIRAAAVVVTW